MYVIDVTTPAGVTRPSAWDVRNQRLPSGPAVIPLMRVEKKSPDAGNVVTTPAGVIRPIDAGGPPLVNHRLPSGPVVMASGLAMPVPTKYDTTPAGVIRPIEFESLLVNQMLPSGPAVMPPGVLIDGSVNGVTTPAGVIRRITFVEGNSCWPSVNQRLPSAPAARAYGL